MIPSANDILYSEYITVNWYRNQTKNILQREKIMTSIHKNEREKTYFLAS